ncbi:LysR family transcriptional regulator [Xanthomonas campestris pv. incanae]|uniref:LysR family transcriptional regulator n=1 Tax=Xanthomonas campestris TaxID=339 RepID=UPI002379EA6F|nr:LysR family transcriptional regulator [Xanthomonas campestris]MDX6083563.1 LysR family transcriptional regulator [Xanthomonas campestris pv. incanae]MDX6085486.1 LysR family transcriptional regulator [Xanthomonas campestris pv. incanae]MDX6140712.1 LysR family transcriptional regulator [Xanthomonas campestris pv. incanae]WDK01729.1 LysR family transcriptional regulator [Xanthomonas campestris]
MNGTNLNEIALFVAVVDAGSFVAGGRAVGVTRSAAGKAFARLEDRLGIRLLNRTTRTISLTDEGRSFYDHALVVLRAVEDAEASVRGNIGTPRGLLRITIPDAYGRLVILPLIAAYLAEWPELQMEVSFSDRKADIVEEGFDLAIRIGEPPPDTRLIFRVIARYKWILVASPLYIASHGEPKSLGELVDHERLTFSSRGERQGWRFRNSDGTWSTARGKSRFRLDSGDAIRDSAISGLGIAFLPELVVAKDLDAGSLIRILSDSDGGDALITAIYPSRRFLEPRVRRFVDLLARELC